MFEFRLSAIANRTARKLVMNKSRERIKLARNRRLFMDMDTGDSEMENETETLRSNKSVDAMDVFLGITEMDHGVERVFFVVAKV